jgi:O-antigen ligase
MQGHLTATSHLRRPAGGLSSGLVGLLLVLPWVEPWAPNPLSNTLPLLISWGALAILLAMARLPTPLELARTWAWAALISSAIGLIQYFGEAPHLGGWVYPPAQLGNAMGNLRQRNQLATLLSMGAVAVLWWHSQGLSKKHALWMLALLAFGSAATSSRTGLLQWFLLPGLLAIWQRTSSSRRAAWSWPLLLWALFIYLLASVALPHLLAAWGGVEARSAWTRMGDSDGCGSRRVLWRNVLELIALRPWSGWGWEELRYAQYMTDFSGERFCEVLGNAHNLPLHLAATLGIPVALALCLSVVWLGWRASPWRLNRPEASLAWGVLAAIGLHSLLEYPLWFGPFQLAVLWALLLLWPAARGWLTQRQRLLQIVAIAALCLMALIGYDYQRMRQVYLPPAQRTSWWKDNPWGAANKTLFFSDELGFAAVTVTSVTPNNAQQMLQASQAMLHYSPERRVVQKLIESARLSGQEELARWHEARMQMVLQERTP